MITFFLLWLLSSLLLMLTAPLMDNVTLWICQSLYGAVTLYGWLYWNGRVADWAFKKQEGK